MIVRSLLLTLLALAAAAPAAAEEWFVTPIEAPGRVSEVRQTDGQVYVWVGDGWLAVASCEEAVLCLGPGQPLDKETDPDGIPGGTVAVADGDGIVSAWYTEPTGRYPHGALGDKIEAGALVVQDVFGNRTMVRLPSDQVFEDLEPHIADFDRDGRNEVLAIRSSTRAGAQLVVYDLAGGTLIEVSATPPIGRPNRWLNIAGIADFTGDGDIDVAAVLTPHIGGTLQIVTLDRRRFRIVDSEKGFSNHIFGSTELGMSAVARINGDGIADLAVPDEKRQALRMMTAAGGSLREIARVPLDAPVATAIGTLRGRTGPVFVLALEGGELVAVWNRPDPPPRRGVR